MIAKVIHPKRRACAGAEDRFAARLRYACGKAAAIETGNLVGTWPAAAVQMRVVAAASARVRQPCHHVVLSWGDGEAPSDTAALAAGRMVVLRMGWQDHQHVLAVHRDRPNLHVHLVLNRVHPRTGRACSLGHDYARLEHACRSTEMVFGWPPDRGRFQTEMSKGVLRLVPMPEAHWRARHAAREAGLRTDPLSVRGPERRSGTAPLRDRLPASILQRAQQLLADVASWAGLHAGLAALGLRYLRHGSGARVTERDGSGAMPACHLGAAFGLARMVARLGRFRPAPTPDAVLPVVARPEAAARAAYDRARAERRARRADLGREHKAERSGLGHALRGLDPVIADAFRVALQAEQRAARTAFRAIPLPRLADYGMTIPAPTSWASRDSRHRHLRREAQCWQADPTFPRPPLDHTRARQLWHLASAQAGPDDRHVHADDGAGLRRVAKSRMLLARRSPDEAVLGYDLITETRDGRLIATPISGMHHALGLIGPRRARHCLVTTDAGMGARLAVARPTELVIVASPSPAPRLAGWLRKLVGGRSASLDCAAGSDDAAQLRACLPQAVLSDAGAPGPVALPPRQDMHAAEIESDARAATDPGDDPPAPG
ncbi:MAG: relaxase/mobilization nuclease domain-containing protein [Paracoccus sp. (in: a-proteobacteria)]|uniref:relaxase/mobilization nuclease domain-containing protein n=1 Tax=Paracoccus sp. TaxID=267 RepID=UPI002E833651|nr:relaxase/mobilization nuclease domain-containing protein [Pseudomonadota bacterium]